MPNHKNKRPFSETGKNDVSPISEIQEDLSVREQRRHLFPHAALVGMSAGLVAALFRIVLSAADTLRNELMVWAQQFPGWGWIFLVLFSTTGAVLSVFLVLRYAPETSGSGIPNVKAVLHRLRRLKWGRVLPVKFFSGMLAIGGGLALGREGPTVQMGGAVGAAISSWLKVPQRKQRTLIAAGSGAGLAAAFNAPLAGVMFVLEEIQRDFHPFVFGAAFLAAAIADVVVRLLTGGVPVLIIPRYPTPPMAALPIFAVLGVLAALLGIAFNRSLILTLEWSGRFKGLRKLAFAAGVGTLVGIVGWFSPLAIGGGQPLAISALSGQLALTIVPLMFLLRFLLTVTSYGSGASGGIFSPLLALGALLGCALGTIAHNGLPAIVPQPGVFAVAGMAAYFAAIVRAPLTGVVLIVEMTGDYEQMLPLLVSSFCAYAVAEWMKDLPIYEALLQRDLVEDNPRFSLKEPMVIDLEVEHGARFAGRRVRDLGLPPGCLIVRCVNAGHEFIPTAQTRIEAFMRITAVISPEASEGLVTLRQGCRKVQDEQKVSHERH